MADSDSDPDDFDSGEPKVKKIRKNEKYIQEGPDSIVDLADPTAFSKVTGALIDLLFVPMNLQFFFQVQDQSKKPLFKKRKKTRIEDSRQPLMEG